MRAPINRRVRFGALVVVCGLLAAACGSPAELFGGDEAGPDVTIGSEAISRAGGAGSDVDAGTDRGTGADSDSDSDGAGLVSPIIDATFEPGTCPFQEIPGHEPRCGIVTVPMDWETGFAGGSGRIDLAVAVFESTADDPAADPVVYLEGGPGSHALDSAEFLIDDLIDPLLARGDVVLFDQRGAGFSTPRLECVEVTEVGRSLEDEPEVDRDDAFDRFQQALARCRDRLIGEGIDLGAYNSINNAHDVEAIRLALGYEQWNLFGISYGTKLGLEVMRRHGDGVRSVVLDSVYPPQVDSVLENSDTFVNSYRRVVAACDAESACRAQGDLEQRIRDVVARYEAEPVRVGVVDWITGEEDEVYADGDTIVGVITGALYSPSQFTDLPELVTELEAGGTEALGEFLSQDRTAERFFSDGMFYAIACQEEVSFADPADVAERLPADPFGLTDDFELASNIGSRAFATCGAFENGQAPPVSNTAVTSDLPTLLMAGEFDPITPVSWAALAAETLSSSWLVVDPSASHGVATEPCGMTVVLRFLETPSISPDGRCLADDELVFLGSPSEPAVISETAYAIGDSGYEIITVRPEDWSVGSLDGDQYRRASFLDPTEMYQLAGNESLGEVLLEFIESSRGVEFGDPADFDNRIGSLEVGELSRTWSRRSASTERATVEWFETEIEGFLVFVILVASPDEYEDLVAGVLVPALETIDITRSL